LPYVQGKKLCELCPDATPALQDLIDQCLKPNPAERPPTAVEVYLRLQELGKASGILLLPPGAMDRLVAARKAGEPTVQYTPADDKARIRRRFLIGSAAAIVVLALLAGVKYFFFSGPTKYEGPESLHGIKLGDSEDEIGDRLSLHQIDSGQPWTLKRVKDHLGHVLRPKDLNLGDAALSSLTIRRTADNKACVLFHQEKVIAIVSSDRAATTGRGVRMGDSLGRLMTRYPDGGVGDDVTLPDRSHVEVRRYPALGIGFELRSGQVTGITLYPPVQESHPER
jgi:hypothetical protein